MYVKNQMVINDRTETDNTHSVPDIMMIRNKYV